MNVTRLYSAIVLSVLCLGVYLTYTPGVVSAETPAWLEYQGYDKTGDVKKDETHISSEELLLWVRNHVAETFSFEPLAFDGQIKHVRGFFTQQGWEAYGSYMNNVKMPTLIKSKNYILSSAQPEDFKILEETEIEGYRAWVMSAPVLLSFFEAYGDDNFDEKLAATAHIDLKILVKRVDKGADRNNIAIHDWLVTSKDMTDSKTP